MVSEQLDSTFDVSSKTLLTQSTYILYICMAFNHVLTGWKKQEGPGLEPWRCCNLWNQGRNKVELTRLLRGRRRCRRLFYLLHPHSSFFPAKPSSHLWRRKVERTETGIESSEQCSMITFLDILQPIVINNAYHLFCIRMYTIRINSSKVEELVDMS